MNRRGKRLARVFLPSCAALCLLALLLLRPSPALGQSFQTYFNDAGGPSKGDTPDEYLIRDEFVSRIGSTSSTIDLCIYNINDGDVRDALISWNNNTTRNVRIVTNMQSGDTNWTAQMQPLIDDGISVTSDTSASLSHNKFAIFDSATLWVASWNHTDDASYFQWNNAIAIDNADLVDGYQDEFDQMFAGDFHGAKVRVEGDFALGGGPLNDHYRMSPQRPGGKTVEQYIVDEIDATVSGNHIYFAIFEFTNDAVCDALKSAHDRGVIIRGIMDCGRTLGQYTKYDELVNYGIDVITLDADPCSIAPYVHDKYMIINPGGADPVVITGSANWTDSAILSASGNDDSTIIIHDNAVAQDYLENWMYIGGVAAGDVVINEIAWTGTTANPGHEWIELHNLTAADIDISDWSIYGADTETTLNFFDADGSTTTVIPAGGYLVYADNDGVFDSGATAQIWDDSIDMSDSSGYRKLILYSGPNATGITVDEANDGGPWFAGSVSGRVSMERINPADPGTDGSNWGDFSGTPFATDAGSNDVNGSPGAENSIRAISTPTPTATPTITPTPTVTQTPTPWGRTAFTSFEEPQSSDPIGYTLSGSVPDDPGSDQWGRWATNPRTYTYSFAAQDCSSSGTCTFDAIDVSGYTGVGVRLWLKTSGSFESGDYARAYVRVDGDDKPYFLDETSSALNSHGYEEHTYGVPDGSSSIVIVYQVRDSADDENIYIDDVEVTRFVATPTMTPTQTPTPYSTFPFGVNFQPADSVTPTGYEIDAGSSYGTYGQYGWQ